VFLLNTEDREELTICRHWTGSSGTLSHTPDFGHSKNQNLLSLFLEVPLWELFGKSMMLRSSRRRYG
jgi:hypothetical protein